MYPGKHDTFYKDLTSAFRERSNTLHGNKELCAASIILYLQNTSEGIVLHYLRQINVAQGFIQRAEQAFCNAGKEKLS